VLLHRGYLVHWSLFLLKDHRNGIANFLSLAFDPSYFPLVEDSFIYLLKYVIILTLTAKFTDKIDILKTSLQDQQDEDNYIQLFDSLYVRFDLDMCNKLRKTIVADLDNDYFLQDYKELINSKVFETIIETYVKLNRKFNLK
jgi:translation initiation factor 3 subunit E